jgi:cytochrome P450 family 628
MLQSEIDSATEKTYQELSQMELLNAAIDETLRLHPAIPSGMQRVTPKKGIQIDDIYIPGDCLVQMPLYSLFRGNFFLLLHSSVLLNFPWLIRCR